MCIVSLLDTIDADVSSARPSSRQVSKSVKERIAAGEVRVVYVPDPENPADYLSKFVDAKKLARSVDYAAGQLRGKA